MILDRRGAVIAALIVRLDRAALAIALVQLGDEARADVKSLRHRADGLSAHYGIQHPCP